MAGEFTKDILDTLLSKLTSIAATKTVVGEPITIGERVILPVVKVSLGVGAGSGEGSGAKGEGKQGSGGGSGGGAGLSISPVAFIVLDGHNVHLFGTKPSALDNLTAKLPELVSTVLSTIKTSKKKDTDSSEEKSEE
ncbi:MAG: spore germination protein GerW family protein [bacterium]|nr:spore germination protein GerW family protein [bacterium]